MQYLDEFICSECDNRFQSASSLLTHFAAHAAEACEVTASRSLTPQLENDVSYYPETKKSVPDLYPIVEQRIEQAEVVNPLAVCEVTLSEDKVRDPKKIDLPCTKRKKYKCTLCQKSFGWSTDLKRHTLLHTGERPFKCSHCSSSFTRNFLLQKHINKCHTSKYNKSKIPDLKPIYFMLKTKMKKTKRPSENNVTRANGDFEMQNMFEIGRNPIYSS